VFFVSCVVPTYVLSRACLGKTGNNLVEEV
jgi:hypothetical protein